MAKYPEFAGLIAIDPLIVLRASVAWLDQRNTKISVFKAGFFLRNLKYKSGFWFFKKEKTRTDEELEYLWNNGNESDWFSPFDRITYDQELADTIMNLSKAAQAASKTNYKSMFITDYMAATLNISDFIE